MEDKGSDPNERPPELEGEATKPEEILVAAPLSFPFAAPVEQLQATGESLQGLGKLIRGTVDLLLKKPDPRPPAKIGREIAQVDYWRDKDTGNLVRTPAGKEVDCRKAVMIQWDASKDLGEDPDACAKLTGREIQKFINDTIEAAKTAAAALCTDPDCPDADIKIRYRSWFCRHMIVQEKHKSELSVFLQLELKCIKK